MKKILLLAALAAGIVWCWLHPSDVRTFAAKATHETGMFLLNLFEKEKLPDPAMPTDPPEPPENVFYTRERIDFGTFPENKALAMATPVRKVGEGNGKFVVESENNRLLVDPVKLTRDPKEIAHLMNLARVPKPVDPNAVRALQSEIEAVDRKLAETNAELRTKEAMEQDYRKKGLGPPLGTNPVFLRNVITRLERQKAQLRKQLDTLSANTNPAPADGAQPANAPR